MAEFSNDEIETTEKVNLIEDTDDGDPQPLADLPPPYTSRDPSDGPSKDEINVVAPGAVRPFPKRSEMRSETHQYQPLTAPQQTMCANVTVVTTQASLHDNNMTYVNPGPKPENYHSLSLCTCFFCCWIFGLIAAHYSNEVDRMWAMRDYEGARRNSKYARNWNIAGIIGGFVTLALLAIFLGLFLGLYYFPQAYKRYSIHF